MAQLADTRALQLQISASSELLIRNLREADNAVAVFQRQTDTRLSAVDASFARVGGGLKLAAGALGAIASADVLTNLIKGGLDYASSLEEVAQQVGVTARDLQVLRYAGSQVGISNEEMDRGLQKFTKSLGDARSGSEKAVGVFKALGFTDADLKRLDAHDALLKTADGLAQITDRAARATPEVALFGKAGQQLDTLLSGGSKAIKELTRAADDLGIVLSHDQIANADRAADKISELKQVLEASIAGAVADNAQAIYDFVEAIEKLVTRIPDAIDAVKRFRLNISEGLAQNVLRADYLLGSPSTRDADRKRIADIQDQKRQLDAGYTQRHPAEFARSSREALDHAASQGGRGYSVGAGNSGAQRRAEADARRAEQERRREIERERAAARESAQLDDAWLNARSQITADTVEQAVIARERLASDTKAKLDDIADQEAAGRLRASEAQELRAKLGRNAAVELDAINQRENISLEREAQQLADTRLGYLRDQADADADLATSARERREIELRLLAAEKAAEKARLEAIAADAARPAGERHYSQGDIDAANAGLSTLDSRYAGREAQTRRGTTGPLENYRDQLQRAVGDTNEALEGLQVNAFGNLENEMLGVIEGTESVGAAFKHMAASIIADLARIAIERAILGSIGGAAGGGGLFGSIIGLVTGKRAAGGPVNDNGLYLVGERGPELFAPGVSGSIIPNHTLKAPSLGRLGGASASRITAEVNVNASPLLDARVAGITLQTVGMAADPIMAGAQARTMKAFNKPKLPGGYG